MADSNAVIPPKEHIVANAHINSMDEYERLYRDSFQHGGISLEEMICPFVVMRPR